MSRRLGLAARLAAGGSLAGILALGSVWHRDRTRAWEEPRWTEAAFIALRSEGRAAEPCTWVMPVNLGCARCLATLRRVHVARTRRARPEGLAALIVDTSSPPGAEALRALPPVAVWWDRDGIWRRRWGHRLYGELMQFDAAGRHVATLAGAEALRGIECPAPAVSHAPAPSGEEDHP